MYVDDIPLTGSDLAGLVETKVHLKRHFVIKNMGKPKYFRGIEVAHQKHSALLSQRKYAIDLLKERRLLGCKSTSTPMGTSVNLWFNDSHILDDPRKHGRLIRKLIYQRVTRQDITFIVGVLSGFIHQPKEVH